MAYRNSQIDRQNFSWFASDRKVNSLAVSCTHLF